MTLEDQVKEWADALERNEPVEIPPEYRDLVQIELLERNLLRPAPEKPTPS